MSGLVPEIAEQLQTACNSHADAIAASIGRLVGGQVVVKVGEAAKLDAAAMAAGVTGQGLALRFAADDTIALMVVPTSDGLDGDDLQAVWSDVGPQLAATLFPDGVTTEPGASGRHAELENLPDLKAAGDGAVVLSIQFTIDEQPAAGALIWPLDSTASNPTDTTGAAAEEPAESAKGEDTGSSARRSPPAGHVSPAEAMRRAKQQQRQPAAALRDINSLPGYARSLLKIEVPVMVSLADKKQPIAEILDLRPGALIQFEKPCENMLDLEVGGYRFAVGEAVKVGDKFGLRITSMITPDERFRKVQGREEK